MRTWILAAGAAALAIGAPAFADAQDRGGGREKAEQTRQGGGKAKATRQARQGGDRQRVRAVRQVRQGGDTDRGRAVRFAQRDDDRERARGQARARVRDRNVEARATARVDRDRDRANVRARGDVETRRVVRDRDDDQIVVRTRQGERRVAARTRVFDNDDVRIVRRSFDRDLFPGRGRGLIAGCPPGLDKKDNGCLPPGQAKRLLGSRLSSAFVNNRVPLAFRTWFRDDDDFLFRSGDRFIYRINRNDGLINGIIPMFGSGYYALGDPWPGSYNFYNVPYQYRSFYYDDYDDDDCYRYDGFGAIYRVDCNNGIVEAIVSLLAGDMGVGSRLPLGYNAYNVPLAYRASYFDTPTAWYRYNDGYIYRVDPQTRLITAVINALV